MTRPGGGGDPVAKLPNPGFRKTYSARLRKSLYETSEAQTREKVPESTKGG